MENDSVRSDQQDWPWPDELDALIAAPENHALLFENESVRVLDTRIGPGRTTPVHTHYWPGALYVRSWSDFVRRDEKGNIVLDFVDADHTKRLEPSAIIKALEAIAV